MKLILRVRKYANLKTADIWLLDGKLGSQHLMHGIVWADTADTLAEKMKELGVTVEAEQSPIENPVELT